MPFYHDGPDKNFRAFSSYEEFINWFGNHPVKPEPHKDFGFYFREFTFLSDWLKPRVIFELGTNFGIGSFFLSKLNPEAKIYSVDNATKPFEIDNKLYPVGHFVRHYNLKNVELVTCNTLDFEPKEVADMIFIDADHSGKAVWYDSLWAMRNINLERHVILWHDFNPSNPEMKGLVGAVDKFSYYVDRSVYRLKDSYSAFMFGSWR